MSNSIRELFLRNTDIQESIIYEYQKNEKDLSSSINGNKLSIRFNETKEESKEKNIKEREKLKENRDKLEIYNSDYYKILRVFENPRSYQSIPNLYEDCKERVKTTYEIKDEKLKEYENILLRIAFYKEIYGNEKFNGDTLKDERPLTFKLLFDNANSDFEKNMINVLINYSSTEITEAIKIIEKFEVKEAIKNIENNSEIKDIKKILSLFKVYFDTFYKFSDEKKMKLIDYYKKNYELFKNNLNSFIDKENSFEGFALIDRMYFLENNESILSILFEKEISYKNRYKDTGISKEIIEISEDLLDKVYKNDKDKLQRRNYLSFDKFYMWCNIGWIEDDNEVIRKSLELADVIEKNTASSTNLSLIEKKYLDYFIKLFRYFFDEEAKEKNREELEKDLFEHVEKINDNKSLISKLEENIKKAIKIDNLLEFEGLKKELFELYKELEEKLHDILSPLDFPLEKNEDLEWRIELWKKLDKKGIEYYEYNNYTEDKQKLSNFYKEFVDKGFEGDKNFEKILKKANKDVFQNEETAENS